MLKAKHNIIVYNFFKFYTRLLLKNNFKSINISGNFIDKNSPLLILSNHISWWDGFWIMYLNLKVFKRKFFFMMLESQLKKHWYFNFTGGFSIKNKSKTIIDSLTYVIELLRDSKNLVLIFPQGEIYSLYYKEFKFKKGIERILKDLDGKVQIFFVANFIEYFSNKKPSVFIYFKEYEQVINSIVEIENAYNIFYNESLSKHWQTNLKR